MIIKRYEVLCEPGSIDQPEVEDVFFAGHPFFLFEMVYDGASSRLSDGSKVRFGEDSTMAKHVGRIVRDVFWEAQDSDSLKEVILRANLHVRRFQENLAIPLDRADLLSGGVIAAIKMGDKTLSGGWAGDCFIVVVQRDGKVWATRNPAYESSRKEGALIQKALEESRGARDEEFFGKFSRIVADFRLKDMNQPKANNQDAFGFLNGQEGLAEHLEEFSVPSDSVLAVILGTDGATSLEDSRDPQVLAKKTWDRYLRGGLYGIVKEARAEKDPSASYVSYDEATLIVIEFV